MYHERNAECPLQRWLSKRATFLHYTYIACLVSPGNNQERLLCCKGRGNVTERISDSMELLPSCLSSVLATLVIHLSFNSFSLAFCGRCWTRGTVQASLYQIPQTFKITLLFCIFSTRVSWKSSIKLTCPLFD
jgi:hypothetical protein